jgi:hypothetical protein
MDLRPFAVALAFVTFTGSLRAQETASFPFVLPWDDSSTTITDMRSLNDRPAGKHGFVRVKGGHLFTDAGRIRFLGVNICMDACFPEHGDAAKVAARMAKFGINCVRFHHMDRDPAPRGIFKADMRTLDPAQMDRLDYFIAQLKKQGIYTDLNLHVSRDYPGQLTWEEMPSFHKGTDNFVPEMVRLQREYARALLTHYNPYTKARYVAEPAVAFVEINNENGLLQIWGNGSLDRMPETLQRELSLQWNVWLKAAYPSVEAMRRAWNTADVPLGNEMLKQTSWNLERHEGAVAKHETGAFGPNSATAHRAIIEHRSDQGWHVQFNQGGFPLLAGKPYTFTFWARANTARTVSVNAMQAHDPWKSLWLDHVELDTQWRQSTLLFRPSGSDANARIGFGEMGSLEGACEFSRMSLRPGGSSSELRDATPGSVRWFPHRGFASLPPFARRDWVRFLWDTEVRYWTGMYRCIRSDLMSRSLIIGTQVANSPGPMQAKMDVVDNHAYWKHPEFPNRPWDGEDWTVENVPMAGSPTAGTLPGLAMRRAVGKPYVVTEYNHPAPNSYGTEMMPILCAYAALQDWDGVFAFDYNSNRALWSSGRIGGFFSIGNHPVKMATLPASAAMFLRGDVSKAQGKVVRSVTVSGSQSDIAATGEYNAWGPPVGSDPLDALRHLCGWTSAPVPPPGKAGAAVWPVRSDTGQLAWGTMTTVDTPRSKSAIGPITGSGVDLGGIRISGDGQWAVVSLTLVSGRSFAGLCRILVTAVADARNTGMRWKDAKRNSVGSRWGTSPALVDGVRATVTLPLAVERVHAWALDERGGRDHEVKVAGDYTSASIPLSSDEKTLWYEIDVR